MIGFEKTKLRSDLKDNIWSGEFLLTRSGCDRIGLDKPIKSTSKLKNKNKKWHTPHSTRVYTHQPHTYSQFHSILNSQFSASQPTQTLPTLSSLSTVNCSSRFLISLTTHAVAALPPQNSTQQQQTHTESTLNRICCRLLLFTHKTTNTRAHTLPSQLISLSKSRRQEKRQVVWHTHTDTHIENRNQKQQLDFANWIYCSATHHDRICCFATHRICVSKFKAFMVDGCVSTRCYIILYYINTVL